MVKAGVPPGLKTWFIPHQYLIINTSYIPKHLGIILDNRLSFEKHLETTVCKINKVVESLTQISSDHNINLFDPIFIMVIFFMIKCIVSSEIRVSSVQLLFSYYWSNVWFIKRETMPRTRF